MKRLTIRSTLAMIMLANMALVVAGDFVEVRGPVGLVIDGNPYILSASRFSGGDIFKGFYYDIDNDIGTESLTLNIRGDSLEGIMKSPGVVYNSNAVYKPFKLEDWGGYYSIGFLGENYFAGYAEAAKVGYPLLYEKSHDSNCMNQGKLLKVLRDDDEERIIKQGFPLKLEDGYELLIRSIDIDGNKVYVELYDKTGQIVNNSVVSPVESDASVKERTYYYTSDIGKIEDIVLLAVHFKNAFHGGDEDLATVDGIFQLSEISRPIDEGSRYDAMRVSNFNPSQMSITMDNRDRSIRLNKNKDAVLMEGIWIRVANPEDTEEGKPLRFYVYKKITEEGIYEIKGDVKETVIGAEYSYDADDFPGFYYDLDDDLGTESLAIKILGQTNDWGSNYLDVIYRTYAERESFNFTKWGEYYAMGYLGEKYFAGYIEDSIDPATGSYLCYKSDDTNLMENGYISKILIDSDEEKVLGKGSSIALDEGYQIQIMDIDVDSDKVSLSLSKDGEVLVRDYVVEIEGPVTPSYCYRTRLEDTGNVVTIALNFKNAFRDMETELVTVNGTWQISNQPEKIERNDEIDSMTVTEIRSVEGDQYIEMRNEDHHITLRDDKSIRLMRDFYVKTADQEVTDSNPLRFYIYRKATIGSMGKDEDLSGGNAGFRKNEALPVERTSEENGTIAVNAEGAEGSGQTMPGLTTLTAISLLLTASRLRIWKDGKRYGSLGRYEAKPTAAAM